MQLQAVTLELPTARLISERALTRVIIAYILCLPLSLMLWFASIGEYSNNFYPLVIAAIQCLPVALLLCSVTAVVFQRLRWSLATWVSVVVPVSLMAFIGLMVMLAITTKLDGS